MQTTLPSASVSWSDYHQAVRRIATKFNPYHGNYRIHDHDFMELVLFVGGTCLHHSVLGDSSPRPGDVVLFRPGAWHGYVQARKLSLYNCCFDTALLGKELSWMVDEPSLGRLLWSIPLAPQQQGAVALHLPAKEFHRCRQLLDELCALAKEEYTNRFGDHLGLLIQVLSLLARNVAATPSPPPVKANRAVMAVLKLIDDAPTEHWTLRALAARVNMEPAYFVRIFHTVVGLPPMAYLNRRRLELATKLLRRNDLTIGDAGALSGWLDANYFSRSFRKHFGMTPSRYRNQFHGELTSDR